ncbi:MAG: hypothetical protein ASARMPREDX12_006801 [Alectoria sarmentosa]|nr:MAG: hypothetical protein ASARMPREDX12_006801 [Alectoria sarmentosa]
MTDFAELAMEGVPLVTEHYDKVYDPLKDKTKQGIQKVKKMREKRRTQGGGYESETDEEIEYDAPPRRNFTEPTRRRSPRDDDRRRSRRDYDDVVEEKYVYKGPNKDRAKSMGRNGWNGGRGDGRKGSRRDYSDSESSVSPRPRERRKSLGEKALLALGLGGAAGAAAGSNRDKRRSRSRRRRSPSTSSSSSDDGYYRRRVNRNRGPSGDYDDDRTPARYKPAGYLQNGDREGGSERGGGQQVARRDNRSEVGSRKGGESKKDNSSSESSDVCSSSEDDRRTKKMKGKEYLTAGLAAVATIHAAHSVYASMEARDKRHMEVAKGELSPEEARKKKNKARIQDAAAIGIAALGIKGAYSEWQEVQENRHELAEQMEERKKRHEKRVKRLEKQSNGGSGGGRSRSEAPSRRRDRS